MYHGVPINSEMIAVAFGILVWIIRGIGRGLKKITRPAVPPVPPQAQTPPQNPFQGQNPFQAQTPFQGPPRAQFPGQVPPPSGLSPAQMPPPSLSPAQPQAARREQARTQPRQPSAGGPAVPVETDRQDFVRQEQELFASEPAGLGVSLTSSASPAAAPNALFGGTDDLVRAIILQEVLGPPLSRRKPLPPQ